MIKPTKKQIAFMNFTNEEIKYELNVECRELNKDLSNLMECLRKQEKDNKAILFVGRNFKKVILPYEEYQKMYQRLEAIDNAEPSEALECLERIDKEYLTIESKDFDNCFNTIQQALLKAQEQEKENAEYAEYKKALEIIIEKNVNIIRLKFYIMSDVDNALNHYNNLIARDMVKQLTQEELDLLKRYFK